MFSVKAKRVLIQCTFWGYSFTLLAISNTFAYRGWVGKVRECLIHALLCHAKDYGSGQNPLSLWPVGMDDENNFLLKPSRERDFLTHSVPLAKVLYKVPMEACSIFS